MYLPAGVAPPSRGPGTWWQQVTASPAFAYVLLLPVIVVLWGYVVGPVVATFASSLRGATGAVSGEFYREFFQLRYTANLQALATSIWISLLSVAGCGAVGVGMAFLLHRFEFPGRRVLQILALVPMALPPLVGVLTFLFLYAESGIIPRGVQAIFHLPQVPFALRGISGVLVVHVFTMYPYFYLSTAAALAGMDPAVEEAAYNLGGSRWDVWVRVLIPMLTPALVAGSLLVFMVSMASYTAPLLFGVERTMTMQIYVARTNGNLGLASAQSTILSIVSVAFLLIMRWYQGRRSYYAASKGAISRRVDVSRPAARWLAASAAGLLVLVLLLPILTLALISFSKDGAWTIQVLPPVYTWENYARLFINPRFWQPIRNSIGMSGIATAGDIVLGVIAAYLIVRLTFRGKQVVDAMVMLPWALPGTVVAINLITAFSQPSVFSLGQVLIGTYWILPLAYFVRYVPLLFRSAGASLAQLDPSLEEAAQNLGADWWYGFRRVVLPLIARGVLGGALLAFTHGVGEFVASILIYTPQNRPLSVAIYNHMYSFEFGTAAAYGMLQVLLILVVLSATRGLEQSIAGGS
jgi:iron(III) transport system permease protein